LLVVDACVNESLVYWLKAEDFSLAVLPLGTSRLAVRDDIETNLGGMVVSIKVVYVKRKQAQKEGPVGRKPK